MKGGKKRQPKSREPIVWLTLPFGVVIRDISHLDHTTVVKLIKRHFAWDEPLCRAMNLDRQLPSLNEFLIFVQYWLRDNTSVVAEHVSTGKILGVMVGRVHDKLQLTSVQEAVQINKNPRLMTINHLSKYFFKQFDIFEMFNQPSYYKVYVWAVHRNFRNLGIGKALLFGTIEMCGPLNTEVITGVMTSRGAQKIMESVGGKILQEVYYKEWKTEEGMQIFRGTGKNEKKACYMAYRIPHVVKRGHAETVEYPRSTRDHQNWGKHEKCFCDRDIPEESTDETDESSVGYASTDFPNIVVSNRVVFSKVPRQK